MASLETRILIIILYFQIHLIHFENTNNFIKHQKQRKHFFYTISFFSYYISIQTIIKVFPVLKQLCREREENITMIGNRVTVECAWREYKTTVFFTANLLRYIGNFFSKHINQCFKSTNNVTENLQLLRCS